MRGQFRDHCGKFISVCISSTESEQVRNTPSVRIEDVYSRFVVKVVVVTLVNINNRIRKFLQEGFQNLVGIRVRKKVSIRRAPTPQPPFGHSRPQNCILSCLATLSVAISPQLWYQDRIQTNQYYQLLCVQSLLAEH